MDRQSLQKLRFDRRLAERTGWISRDDLDREINALPDVAGKLTTLGEAEERNANAASARRAGSQPTQALGSAEPSAVGSGEVEQPHEPETP